MNTLCFPPFLRLVLLFVALLWMPFISACSGLNDKLHSSDPPVYAASSQALFNRTDGPSPTPKPKSQPVADASQQRPVSAEVQRQAQRLTGVTAYRIGQDDILNITIGEAGGGIHENLRVTIDGQGVAELGDYGAYRLGGLNPLEAQKLLVQELEPAIPGVQVILSVSEARNRYVRLEGAIYSPGAYPMGAGPMSLADAIAEAGSLLRTADLSRIQLTRGGERIVLNLHTMQALGISPDRIQLQSGDTLHFPEK